MSRSISDNLRSKLRRTPEAIEKETQASFTNISLSERIDVSTLVVFPRPHPTTIDVIPDIRLMIPALHDGIMKGFAASNFRESSLATPAAMMAYCLQIIFGFMLICDSAYRSVPSPMAENILHLPMLQELLDILANLHVPDFLVPILIDMLPFTDSVQKGLDFVPSLACYHHALDFGRVLPASIFIAAHNAISNNRSNMDPSVVSFEWLRTALYTITGDNLYSVNDYIYSYQFDATDNTLIHLVHSWFSDYVFSLSNPVTSRFQSARPTFSSVPFPTQTFASFATFNPYLVCLGINGRNATGIMHFMKSMSEFSKTSFNAGLTIFSIIENSTGSGSICNHLISGPAYPTWRLKKKTAIDALPNSAKFDRTSILDFQDQIKFLVAPDYSGSTADIGFPKDTSPMTATNAGMFILSNKTNLDTAPTDRASSDEVEYITFDENKHYTPDMLVYNSTASTTSALFGTVVSGRIIENGNIDGFATHIANPDLPSPFNNAHLGSSAVNATNVIYPISIGYDNYRTVVTARATFTWPKMPIVTLLNDVTTVHLPRTYAQQLGITAPTQVGLSSARTFVNLISATSFLGRVSASAAANIPGSTKQVKRVAYLWSSYRILEDEQHAFQLAPTILTEGKRIGILSSLKHIFGARSLVGKIPHPSVFIH